jgi:K+-transporting ATPase ATPase C chain
MKFFILHPSHGRFDMPAQLRPALMILLLLTLLTGLAYPLFVTGIAQAVFPRQANGSLIVQNGQVVGSSLSGQPFDDPRYFWGRLSATGAFPYNAFNAENLTASSGSNYGPLNPALIRAAQARIDALKAVDPANTLPIPVDLVTASGSGLDPHISPAAAAYQLDRVARARGLDPAVVRQLIDQHTLGRDLGLLGEPRVNVLELNLALDALAACSETCPGMSLQR